MELESSSIDEPRGKRGRQSEFCQISHRLSADKTPGWNLITEL